MKPRSNSTMEHSKKLNIVISSVTLNQQLWIKALKIMAAKQFNIVSYLRDFTCSFYDNIDNINKGLGVPKFF